MCSVTPDPKTYFPKIEGNLTRVVWAHAVNSQELLNSTLKREDVMMLEGDVVLGRLNTSAENAYMIPIMAHPPNNQSDLSLEEFLKTVSTNKGTMGVKLDFKSLEAFTASQTILKKAHDDFEYPIFLNADILPGPVNATTLPVDAKAFVSQAKSFENCTLSIGWTTRYGKEDNIKDGAYTIEQIDSMIKTLKEHNVTQSVTYAVRAGLAANSATVIKSLIEQSSKMKNPTLTIWSSEGDEVNAEKLSQLIKDVDVQNVYIDVPESLMKKLQLSGASSLSVTTMIIGASLFVSMFLSSVTRRV
ncbi:PREDICTED: protein FAM151B [Dufourea novaeangliae]|uniref:protein FAM151B n=1 Tax=Dufourea novaeangliae TaxID=178035 RepID=UPI0007673FEC|nr:PREDICTED: protein FAM151B [Dufourea novaeangliae]